MATLIDTCPVCGQASLTAVCDIVAGYAINNDGDSRQDWQREWVDDDCSVPSLVKCEDCGGRWERGQFTLNDQGFLVELRTPA